METILQSSPRKQKQTPNHLYFPTVNNSLASYQLSASKKFINGRFDHRDVTEEAKGSLCCLLSGSHWQVQPVHADSWASILSLKHTAKTD